MDKKNIAIIIDSLGGGGAERVMLDLAKGMVAEGHRVHFIALESRKEYEVPSDVSVSVLYEDRNLKRIARGRYIESSAKKLKGMIYSLENEKEKFNLFISNLDPTNALMAKCGLNNVYYMLHNAMKQEIARERKLGPVKWYKKVRAKKVMDHKDLIAVSKGVAKEAVNLGVITPKSVTTIYNPVDIDKVKSLSLMENDLIPVDPFILSVGRVVKQKRHDVLFKALKLVPNIKLVLLCKDVEKARSLARKIGVEDRVVTPGFSKNPYAWMKAARLTVVSSDYEGLCMALIESIICGTPVVSTDCEYGPAEILTGELAEFLSPCGDYKGLAENIKKALENPPKIEDVPILKEVTLEKAVEGYLALAN